MDDNYVVYIHINKINDKKYVGITKTSLKKRCGKNGSGYMNRRQEKFSRAIQKYGWDNFYHIVFSSGLSKERACALEILLIGTLRTRDPRFGYNIQIGGQLGNTGMKFSDEAKEKMRQAKLGKKLSEEHKRKISQSMMGRKPVVFTESSIEKLRAANLGKTLSEETKAKISRTLTGIVRSEETCKKNE